ncbi:efflux RND transporter periplasmic adaptor subunit [Agaribacterium sp. ZY112]|uniref:efflux RND transporter periplasmic adaptor subunit n=1 Tax=Agaribacterium sp. ZY112 TaxID=3233574 RepID=UPI0035241F83
MKKPRPIHLFYLSSALLILLTALIALDEPSPKEAIKQTQQATLVSTQTIFKKSHKARLSLNGYLKPNQQAKLHNLVEGQVEWISPAFNNGAQVQQGQSLIRLENSALKAELKQANVALAQAELSLLQAQRRSQRAIEDWKKHYNKVPTDPLVSKTSQLKLAQAEVESAQAQLNYALRRLSYSDLKAPFDGELSQRQLSLGEWLDEGQELIHISANTHLELELQLSPRQWQQLFADHPPQSLLKAFISNSNTLWPITLENAAQQLDPDTQLRSLFFQFDSTKVHQVSAPAPRAGLWVDVKLEGIEHKDLWAIPHSAFSKNSLIWWLDKHSRLRSSPAISKFKDANHSYVYLPELKQASIELVLYPQARFIDGQLAEPHKQDLNAQGGHQ